MSIRNSMILTKKKREKETKKRKRGQKTTPTKIANAFGIPLLKLSVYSLIHVMDIYLYVCIYVIYILMCVFVDL